jgi:arylsulfatase A
MRVLLVLLALVFAASARQPNLIMIMADDLGYECIGANGSTSCKTPVLDQLAATGMRFEHCNTQPLCTPTRVQLMTGLYNVRNYINFGTMDPASTTFANVLKQAGYATCITGKWQLGQDRELPKEFGFDEHCLWQHTRRPPRYANPGLEINGVEKDCANGEYGPDLVNDYALDFVARKKDTPFFLYYPMILTHSPYQATPDSKTWDPKLIGENKGKRPEHFADMVAYMDKLIGKLVAKLDELNLRGNTLILFIGDNGTGAGTRTMTRGGEVIGGKGSLKPTGTHVPLIANGFGVAKGKVCADLVDSTDFLPTLCDAAGVTTPAKLDGRSFFPQLRGERGQPREWWYCWYAPRDQFVGEFAANHRYKLYRNGSFFDLRSDAEEKQPLTVAKLEGEAAAAATTLQSALDQFRDARPAHLVKATSTGKGKRRKADK